MGNWRTVNIVGTCPPDEVDSLVAAAIGEVDADGWESSYKPLGVTPPRHNPGLAGLQRWPAAEINAYGNLYERDFTVADVADHLAELAKAAPGLRLKVHCGDDWEASNCIATVTLDDTGVHIGEPEVAEVRGASAEECVARMMTAMRAAPR